MSDYDPLEIRAREFAVIAGVNPDFMVATDSREFPAWYAFREAARAEQELRKLEKSIILPMERKQRHVLPLPGTVKNRSARRSSK